MKPVTLSIVIVNYKTLFYTLQCIQSIKSYPPACPYEIILIDNGSGDKSPEIIRDQHPDVLCISTGKNLGFAKANNLGINNVRGDLVLLLNSDTRINDNSLSWMADYLRAHPELGAIGPRQTDGEGRLQLSWGEFPTLVSEFLRKLMHSRLAIGDPNVRGYLEEKYAGSYGVDWVSGSCLMARKKAITDAGLLDEHFFMYFEDVDLCARMRKLGWKIHFCSEASITHYGGVSAQKNILHVMVEYRHSQIYFTRKYYGVWGVLLLKLLLLSKYSMYLARWGTRYTFERIFNCVSESTFAKLLLSKKSIELVFRRERQSTECA